MPFFHSLRSRFFLSFLMLACGILLFVYYQLYQARLEFLLSKIESQLTAHVNNIQNQFNVEVSHPLKTAMQMSVNSSQLEDYLSDHGDTTWSKQALEKLFLRLIKLNQPQLKAVHVIDATGQEQIRVIDRQVFHRNLFDITQLTEHSKFTSIKPLFSLLQQPGTKIDTRVMAQMSQTQYTQSYFGIGTFVPLHGYQSLCLAVVVTKIEA
ncbi:MAG: hypothetical protein AAF512_07665 [Pseudomonadota bacterium]